MPSTIVATESPAMKYRQSSIFGANASANSFRNRANPPDFDIADISAVTGNGAPSYASGVHIWNGTAATLKPSPAMIKASPRNSASSMPPVSFDSALPMSPKCVDPVAP